MRTQLITALAGVMLCAPGKTMAQAPAPPAPLQPALVGAWKAKPYERPLSSEFERSVWGPDAVSVRDVDLTVRSSGDATLTVTTKVLDARRRTVAGSTAIEVAQLSIGGPQERVGVRTDHTVTVKSAERTYPDDPKHPWPLEGLRVKVTTLEDAPRSIDLRFDTPEGRGSFWETLERQGGPPRRSGR